MINLYTFGDSILDAAKYNRLTISPAQLIARNEDAHFPEFAGNDLTRLTGTSVVLHHHARDGSTAGRLAQQRRDIVIKENGIVLLTVGGNDVLARMKYENGHGLDHFRCLVEAHLTFVADAQIFIGNVYDPFFGSEAKMNIIGDARELQANLKAVNDTIAELATKYGTLVDIHRHFLGGRPDWFAWTIEPSLIGASEIRRKFMDAISSTRLRPRKS